MWRFKKFVCALDEEQQRLSDRERFRLFLKQEGLRDREQRRRYLLFLWHDRHDLAERVSKKTDGGPVSLT